ncbi:hypothetical protein [Candidatus Nitrospira salsa]
MKARYLSKDSNALVVVNTYVSERLEPDSTPAATFPEAVHYQVLPLY